MNYFILFTQRSGSSHLCNLLASIGLGKPGEYGLFEDRTFDRLTAALNEQGEIAGVKIDWETLKDLLKQPDDLMEQFSPRLIYLKREDRLGQAISWAKALQTAEWSCFDSAAKEPVYDRKLVAQQLKVIDWQEARFGEFIKDKPCLELTYEQPDEEKLALICNEFNFEPQGEPKSYFRKQADAVNEDWRKQWQMGK